MTSFGSPAGQPALGLLRAVASRHGLSLGSVDALDAAASVVAAHLWVRATDSANLGDLDAVSDRDREALSVVLCRAAGLRHGVSSLPPFEGVRPSEMFGDVDLITRWLQDMFLPSDVVTILRMAANDLACGGGAVAASAALLTAAADIMEDTP